MSAHNGDRPIEEILPERLTAYALGQLEGEELAAVKTALSAVGSEAAHQEIRDTRAIAAAMSAVRNAEPLPSPSSQLRERIEQLLSDNSAQANQLNKVALPDSRRPWWRLTTVRLIIGGGVCSLLLAILLFPAIQTKREAARRAQANNSLIQRSILRHDLESSANSTVLLGENAHFESIELRTEVSARSRDPGLATPNVVRKNAEVATGTGGYTMQGRSGSEGGTPLTMMVGPRIIVQEEEKVRLGIERPGEAKHANQWDRESARGAEQYDRTTPRWEMELAEKGIAVSQTELRKYQFQFDRFRGSSNTEQYDQIIENPFLAPLSQPLSTFSIDVDTASYANVRRFLNDGRLPPRDAVRIEELVNYFRYDYPQPKGSEPFSVNMEVTECPWREGHLLLRVGLKGKEVRRTERPRSNLVFLLDVSGSMADANKLPLLKTAMQMLVRELGENDRVAIVTYAGEAGLRLPPTPGHQQEKILGVIESLSAGGSTNGSAGIELAYEQAAAHFIAEGTNRVILCTDGDLNVGVTDDEALVKLIKRKAADGTFLTVLGFGEGNLKDAKMEKLADNGNGLYAYIDSVREARKVLVEQLTGSTITIAKDVKLQIEFNPREIAAYRLLGYENRVLAAQDFNNDKKDAGEIGAGHTVTALYELVPVGATSEAVQAKPGVDPLRYQGTEDRGQESGVRGRGSEVRGQEAAKLTEAAGSGELLTLKLRYKEPEGQTSKLLEYPLKNRGGSFQSASGDLQFSAALASFGMILRGSEHRGSGNLAAVAEIASTTLGTDPGGYRSEFVDLVRKAQTLGAK